MIKLKIVSREEFEKLLFAKGSEHHTTYVGSLKEGVLSVKVLDDMVISIKTAEDLLNNPETFK